ncbi:hypothetical protein AB0451_35345 [Streptomyces sp. NPDC052000]
MSPRAHAPRDASKSSGPYHRVNAGTDGFDYAATFIYTVLPREDSARATS